MAVDAAIRLVLPATFGDGQCATADGVALQTTVAVVLDPGAGVRNGVRVVTADAAEAAGAGLGAATGAHLLGVAADGRAFGELGTPHEGRHEQIERQAGPV